MTTLTLSDLARDERPAGPRTPLLARVRLAGLRLSDALLIAAILGLVLVVSLPRIEAYARTTNERDARLVTALLGERLLQEGRGELSADLPALVADDEYLEHRLRDARRLPETEILLFHGYYYRLDRPTGTLYAWPRLAGGTGRPAFAFRAGAGLFVHPNERRRWSGQVAGRASEVTPEVLPAAPIPRDACGWTPLEAPALDAAPVRRPVR